MANPRNPLKGPEGSDPRGSPGTPSRGPLIPTWVWWALLAAMLVWNGYALFAPQTPPTVSISYTDFLAKVRAGQVASVTMSGQQITGQFKQPINYPADQNPSGASAAPAATPGAQATPAQEVAYTRFNTVMPANGDTNLMPLLEAQSVNVVVKDTSGGSWLMDLLVSVLPLLFLVGILFFFLRQTRSGQQNMFNFGGSKARLYDQERPKVTFKDVAGEEESKMELREVVDFLKQPDRYRALGARLPRGVLLVGPPGTGKTLLARAVAGEAGVPFFTISASEFVEMFVGVGASRVRDLFNKAKATAPAIVFVDELDAVGRQRGAGLGGGNDEREQTLNQLLVEMDGFDEETNVIVIAATNRPDVLDPALLRPGRFDRQVTIGLPDRKGREDILQIHTRKLIVDPDVDLSVLAKRTPGFSGADLANLANEAALFAARRGGNKVTMKDFDDAMDKIVLGTRQATVMSDLDRRVVAYHEGGHALVAMLTPGADPVNKVTIIPRGRALGVTEQLPEDDRHNYPKDYLLGRLAVMMGGRVAEELVFSQPTTGAENDLKQATNLARRMVGLWGMSEEMGPVSYGIGETHPFLGRELGQPREYAEATAADVDAAVRKILETAYRQARSLLTRHRETLDELANQLLAHETIDARQIQDLLVEVRAAMSDQRPQKQ
ncbi:MAG: ATP-dependent zinc metalloprotease FtsH [Dehalococcoidales bacterium]|nr:ATP-dependent zinc metalloprotease FtsH [Dehalococcoidales bacterium]